MGMTDAVVATKICQALDESVDALPRSVADRLAASRKIALSRKKQNVPLRVFAPQNSLAGRAGSFFNHHLAWVTRIAVATPLLIGLAVLAGIYQSEQQQRLNDVAELDASILADELPVSAYLDRGFNAYLAQKE